MRVFVALALIGLVARTTVESSGIPLDYDYHRDVGIPMAARIKAAEAMLDGTRIVGGSPAQLGQYPYLGGIVVTLTDQRISVCATSLLSSTRSLTAAACWRTFTSQASSFTLVWGSTTLFTGGTRVVTTDVETHTGFNGITPIDNIAMIRFPALTLNENIQPIAIATGMDLYVGRTAWAAGYGLTSDGGAITSGQVLHHVSVQIIHNVFCQLAYGPQVVWMSSMCASATDGRGTCTGDSGGPLVTDNLLIGITSFGHRTCEEGHPVGFTRITSYTDWIRARM